MERKRLYLETSVWNFLLVDDAPELRITTEKLFRKIRKGAYEIFISQVVIMEINDAPSEKRRYLLKQIDEHKPALLEVDDEVTALAEAYLENGVLTGNHMEDLFHVAISSVNDLNIIVSWNLRHLVKHRTRMLVNAVNRRLGYREIDICRPEEVLEIGD